ncbi:MAG: nucleotidyltransferase domain-containing protein [Oscillospiraceae bacterium]|nr:nucleotidyltransferase domain-containing protein [Oscillospiraceae bacterium]
MDTLMNSIEIDKITYLINQHIELFNSFNNIYLFGSLLSAEKNPNDIDILLIYSEFSNNIIDDLNIIYSSFANLSGFQIDLTVLSVEEEKDTNFLKRLNSKYLKLK